MRSAQHRSVELGVKATFCGVANDHEKATFCGDANDRGRHRFVELRVIVEGAPHGGFLYSLLNHAS